MESHIINIVRFATCITIFVVCIILMFKADDNNLMRRLSAAFGVIFISVLELWFTFLLGQLLRRL